MPEKVPYDEFAYFADNAKEYGIRYAGPPTVRRVATEVSSGRQLSALVWGTEPAEFVLIHGGAQNAIEPAISGGAVSGFPDAITGQLVPAKSRRRRQG